MAMECSTEYVVKLQRIGYRTWRGMHSCTSCRKRIEYGIHGRDFRTEENRIQNT